MTSTTVELDRSARPAIHQATRRSAIPVTGRESSFRATFEDPFCRVLSLIVALVGIVLTFPVMLIIALAVRLSSPGPILFTQPRIGVDRRHGRPPKHIEEMRKRDLGGRVFTIYKFRTMRVESGTPAETWATDNDPRITRVGKLLRRTRLDELPQLFNVLRGDMNIVGPRPEQPGIFQELRGQIDGYQARQKVLPGITGWAQVNQSYDQDLEDVRRKVALDLQYIEDRSAVRDFLIMARTLPVMLFRRGAL